MSNVSEIKASIREKIGTGESRMHRRDNKVPGIIYGEKKILYQLILILKF